MEMKRQSKTINRLIPILFWIVVFSFIARMVNNPLFLPTPLTVFQRFFELLTEPSFYVRSFFTLSRIATGFVCGFFLAVIAGALSFHFALFERFISPLVHMIQSVPVASFTLLALFWMNAEGLSVFIASLVVFPLAYHNVLTGLKATDSKMREMGKIFNLSAMDKLRAIELPALFPYLKSALLVGMELGWKAGTAAEIIALVNHSIGEALYDAKIYLDMSGLFAWTLWILVLSFISVRICQWLLERVMDISKKRAFPQKKQSYQKTLRTKKNTTFRIEMHHVTKAFQGKKVINDFSTSLHFPSRVMLAGPSGRGKTTLINLLLGLQPLDCGKIIKPEDLTFSVVFQENRLIDNWTVEENCLLVAPESKQAFEKGLTALELTNARFKKAHELSGGMKRRTALLRASLYPADLLILDEPFQGLDLKTEENVIAWLNQEVLPKFNGLILISHDPSLMTKLQIDYCLHLHPKNDGSV